MGQRWLTLHLVCSILHVWHISVEKFTYRFIMVFFNCGSKSLWFQPVHTMPLEECTYSHTGNGGYIVLHNNLTRQMWYVCVALPGISKKKHLYVSFPWLIWHIVVYKSTQVDFRWKSVVVVIRHQMPTHILYIFGSVVLLDIYLILITPVHFYNSLVYGCHILLWHLYHLGWYSYLWV